MIDTERAGYRRRHARVLTAATVAVMVTGGCTEQGLAPDEQRDTMVAAARTAVDELADYLNTDAVSLTDDGTTLRACPDGGSSYAYVATIGPVGSEGHGSSARNGASRVHTYIVGMVMDLQTNPTFEGFPRFDEDELVDEKSGDPRSSFWVTQGDLEGLSLRFTVVTSGDELSADVSGSTRCG